MIRYQGDITRVLVMHIYQKYASLLHDFRTAPPGILARTRAETQSSLGAHIDLKPCHCKDCSRGDNCGTCSIQPILALSDMSDVKHRSHLHSSGIAVLSRDRIRATIRRREHGLAHSSAPIP